MRSDRPTRGSGGALAALETIAAFGLFVMMMVTVVDVGGRYLFRAPLRAGFELTEYLMGLLVFVALPLVSLARSHVRITLLDGILGPRATRLRDRAVGVVSGAVCLLVAWSLARLAARMGAYGDGTQTLGLPLAPLAWIMVASLVVSALVVMIQPFLRR